MSAKRVPRGAVPSVNGMVADAGRVQNSGARGMFFAVSLSRAGARPSDVMIADFQASGRCLQALFMMGAEEGFRERAQPSSWPYNSAVRDR
jgi:hypothetical protein